MFVAMIVLRFIFVFTKIVVVIVMLVGFFGLTLSGWIVVRFGI